MISASHYIQAIESTLFHVGIRCTSLSSICQPREVHPSAPRDLSRSVHQRGRCRTHRRCGPAEGSDSACQRKAMKGQISDFCTTFQQIRPCLRFIQKHANTTRGQTLESPGSEGTSREHWSVTLAQKRSRHMSNTGWTRWTWSGPCLKDPHRKAYAVAFPAAHRLGVALRSAGSTPDSSGLLGPRPIDFGGRRLAVAVGPGSYGRGRTVRGPLRRHGRCLRKEGRTEMLDLRWMLEQIRANYMTTQERFSFSGYWEPSLVQLF